MRRGVARRRRVTGEGVHEYYEDERYRTREAEYTNKKKKRGVFDFFEELLRCGGRDSNPGSTALLGGVEGFWRGPAPLRHPKPG